jgi:Xaa-Pro aminopeptidase
MQSYSKQTRAVCSYLCIIACIMALFLGAAVDVFGADKVELRQRRQRAAANFHDGILLIHAKSVVDATTDGFRQDAAFYYFTGLENTLGALLAIDGRSGEGWLFVTAQPPFSKIQPPEAAPSPAVANQLGIEHVVDWSELESFLAQRASSATTLYYQASSDAQELPPNITGDKDNEAPLWLITIGTKWSSFRLKEVGRSISALMDVQSPGEIVALRAAAKATVSAVMDGMRAIRSGVSQRSVEAIVENACWKAGAHGSSFWPWVMAGENAVFPRPFVSFVMTISMQRCIPANGSP